MKNIIFIGSLAASICQTCLAQSGFPFPTANAEWIVYKAYPIVGPTDHFFVFRDFVLGDSVFLGKTYTKVFRQNLCSCICASPVEYQPDFTAPVLLGGVREEGRKVYFTRFGAGTGQTYYSPVTDTLLFDFSAEAGDTIPYGNGLTIVVDHVDTTAEGRREIHYLLYPPGAAGKWTEGIGGNGLLETTDFYYINGFCFSDQEPSECVWPCAITALEEPDPGPGIVVWPSPATTAVHVDMRNPSESYALEIVGSDGTVLDRRDAVAAGDRIDIEYLPRGLLVFRFTSRSGAVRVSRVVRE